MLDADRMSVEEFFAWHQHVEGRYELVEGRIVPHPDYVTPEGLAAPSNEHAAILANLALTLGSKLQPPCRIFIGAGAAVDRITANIADLSVSCDPSDLAGSVLKRPRFVFEVLSPKTKRIDVGRKVLEHLAIPSLDAYVVVDGEHRSVTVYRPDAGAQTYGAEEAVVLSADLELTVAELFA